jgi:hypothetical protein
MAMVVSLTAHLRDERRGQVSAEITDQIAGWCEIWCRTTKTPLPEWLIELKS